MDSSCFTHTLPSTRWAREASRYDGIPGHYENPEQWIFYPVNKYRLSLRLIQRCFIEVMYCSAQHSLPDMGTIANVSGTNRNFSRDASGMKWIVGTYKSCLAIDKLNKAEETAAAAVQICCLHCTACAQKV